MVQRWPWATDERRWRLHDNALKIGKSGEPSNIRNWMSLSLLGPVFFRTGLSCSGDNHLERGWMPLNNAVGRSCKKGATTENKHAGVKYTS